MRFVENCGLDLSIKLDLIFKTNKPYEIEAEVTILAKNLVKIVIFHQSLFNFSFSKVVFTSKKTKFMICTVPGHKSSSLALF